MKLKFFILALAFWVGMQGMSVQAGEKSKTTTGPRSENISIYIEGPSTPHHEASNPYSIFIYIIPDGSVLPGHVATYVSFSIGLLNIYYAVHF